MRLRSQEDSLKCSSGDVENMRNEIEKLRCSLEDKQRKIEEAEKERSAHLKYIECIQKDCEQVVSAKEEWLGVMRSFKESEEKVYSKYKNLRKAYEQAKTDLKELRKQNGELEVRMEFLIDENKNKTVLDKNISPNENIKRFNELRAELAQLKKDNIKMSNDLFEHRQRAKDREEIASTVKAIKECMGIRTATKGLEQDLHEISKAVSVSTKKGKENKENKW